MTSNEMCPTCTERSKFRGDFRKSWDQSRRNSENCSPEVGKSCHISIRAKALDKKIPGTKAGESRGCKCGGSAAGVICLPGQVTPPADPAEIRQPAAACFRRGAGAALRRLIMACRRNPRSHGIRVLQACASSRIDFIQRRWDFISVSIRSVLITRCDWAPRYLG